MKPMFAGIDQLSRSMSFHRDRHTVLAGNVANVDTPGYKPFDLERVDESSETTPGRTDDGHLSLLIEAGSRVQSFDDSGETTISADGNAVNLERELAKVDANRVRYNAVGELVTRRLALLRYGATDGQG